MQSSALSRMAALRSSLWRRASSPFRANCFALLPVAQGARRRARCQQAAADDSDGVRLPQRQMREKQPFEPLVGAQARQHEQQGTSECACAPQRERVFFFITLRKCWKLMTVHMLFIFGRRGRFLQGPQAASLTPFPQMRYTLTQKASRA